MSQSEGNNERLTRKEQRMKQAVRLYYGEGLTQHEIAEEVGVTRKTIQRYLEDPDAQQFIRPYSDKEEQELREYLEEKRKNIEELTAEVAHEVMNSDISPEKKLRAVKELRDDASNLIEFLDATGVLRKSPDRKEVQHSGEVSVLERVRKYYEEEKEEAGKQ